MSTYNYTHTHRIATPEEIVYLQKQDGTFHVYYACENCGAGVWSAKNLTLTDKGRFVAIRSIFFRGPSIECHCSSSHLRCVVDKDWKIPVEEQTEWNYKVTVSDYEHRESEHNFRVRRYPTSDPEVRLYYAVSEKFGCSKNYKTQRGAIIGMLTYHACIPLKIVEIDDKLNKPEGYISPRKGDDQYE